MRLALTVASSLLLIAAVSVFVRSSHESQASLSLVDVPQHTLSHGSLFSKLGAGTSSSGGSSGSSSRAGKSSSGGSSSSSSSSGESASGGSSSSSSTARKSSSGGSSSSSSSSFDAAALFSKPNDVHASSMLVKTKPGQKLDLAPVRRFVTPGAQPASLSIPQSLRAASEIARSHAASLFPANKVAKPDEFDGVKDWLIETIPQVRYCLLSVPTPPPYCYILTLLCSPTFWVQATTARLTGGIFSWCTILLSARGRFL